MKYVLLYGRNYKIIEELATMAAKLGYVTKSVFELDIAKQLLQTREYDLLVVSNDVSFQEQEKLAALLWDKRPSAPMLLFIEEGSTLQASRFRLMGAEVVGPTHARETFKGFLESFLPKRKKQELQILYVEDLDAPREIISMFIDKCSNASVDACASAKEALEKLEDNPGQYSCIVTDIRMPEMDGCELTKTVRANKKLSHLPIIVLTAFGTMDWLVDCLKAGASGFLVKPPSQKSLRFELERALRINEHRLNPCLTDEQGAEQLRDILDSRL